MNDFDEKDLDPMTEDHSAHDTDPIDDGADEAMSSLGETTVLDPAVDETVENPALDANERDEVETDEAPKRPRKALAIAAGLALVAVLGIGGAWVTGAFSGGEAPEVVKDAATSVQAAVKGEAKVSISAKADGWTEDLPASATRSSTRRERPPRRASSPPARRSRLRYPTACTPSPSPPSRPRPTASARGRLLRRRCSKWSTARPRPPRSPSRCSP